jgi:anaerobic magnesium-protoporphyrin IX monomethyl ester cyclase
MKVLLIYPPLTLWERYSSDIGHAGGRQLPLGIFYLAAYIRAKGHEVCVIDAEAEQKTIADITALAERFHPDAVGISATTVAFPRGLQVTQALKDNLGDVPIIIGGPHVTAAADDVLSHPSFDVAVLGEGEVTLADLLDTLATDGDLAAVDGIAFRRNGQTIMTPRRPFIEDIDNISFPAYDLVPDMTLYNPPPANYKTLPVANIITSRGCPNQCTFCDRSVFGRKMRLRSPENIAAEIEMLYRQYHIREIAFVDDTFTLRPQRIIELFRILDEKKIRFPWTCMSRINTVDYEILKFMKQHGCWHISFGIESGSEEILRLIKKKISLKAAGKVIEICRNLRIRTKGFFIVGHPRETVETIEQTIRLALDLPLDDVVVTLNTPLPGTEQYESAGNYGMLDHLDWSSFNMWNPVFIPSDLSRDLLISKHKEFYRRFYLRPRIIARYLQSFMSAAGIRRFFALFQSLPFLFNFKKLKP